MPGRLEGTHPGTRPCPGAGEKPVKGGQHHLAWINGGLPQDIGLALMLGVGIRIAAVSGIAMLALMYTGGSISPDNNRAEPTPLVPATPAI